MLPSPTDRQNFVCCVLVVVCCCCCARRTHAEGKKVLTSVERVKSNRECRLGFRCRSSWCLEKGWAGGAPSKKWEGGYFSVFFFSFFSCLVCVCAALHGVYICRLVERTKNRGRKKEFFFFFSSNRVGAALSLSPLCVLHTKLYYPHHHGIYTLKTPKTRQGGGRT